ncbi:hypothetical protein Ahy_B02g061135 [Arachis hypogaea]|uniref:Uncharacterized protein n=1 Tax=Arachis hypogaea TaxID=3818 RepID=A0A445AK40_ARAHY|nr:hypothetical protein Ahy_B02g061135 [Arachis hypogaea]
MAVLNRHFHTHIKRKKLQSLTHSTPFFLLARASILSEHTTLSFPQCKEALRQCLLPSRASPLSAGYDLSRYLSLSKAKIETDAVLFLHKIPARGKALVATDISISIPEGTDFFVFVWGFLGLLLKHWIDVGAGVIDDDLSCWLSFESKKEGERSFRHLATFTTLCKRFVIEDFDEFSDVDELYSSLPLDKILLQSPLGYLRIKGKSNVHDFILAAQACIPIISAVLVEIKNQSNVPVHLQPLAFHFGYKGLKRISKAQLQALVSYIASKEGGKIPIQLAGMFPTQQVSQGLDQESEIPSPKELGSRSSGASNKEA